jgi:aspartyl protease family protein
MSIINNLVNRMSNELPPNSSPPPNGSQPPADTKKIGKGMMAAAWIIALLLLVKVFGTWEKHQFNPNQNVDSTLLSSGERVVQLKRNRFGHYVTTGFINNQAVTFLLDTGATTVSIPAGVAERIGLRRGTPKSAMTANGTITVYDTQVDRVAIGNITLNDVRADINPYMDSDGVLLGMSVLKYLDFAQEGDTLTLRQL